MLLTLPRSGGKLWQTKKKISYSHLKDGNTALQSGLCGVCFPLLSDSDTPVWVYTVPWRVGGLMQP